MLAEFAFTPSIFDESAHADVEAWKEQLRELGYNMFPRTGAWPVMVSNLYSGSWHAIALEVAGTIKDPKARELCEGLLQNAARTLVVRPAHRDDWPGEDPLAWGREAISSHGREPIERIISCRPAHLVLSQECRFIRHIGEVEDAGFWSGITSSWSQSMRIVDQVGALRKLCVHSEFLCLVTPHIKGGADDETDFVLSLIRSAFQRPADYSAPNVEIHTEAPDSPASSDYAVRLARITHNIGGSIRLALAPGQTVRLIVWPKLLDRYVIAGVHTVMADGSRLRSPRWGVAMQHIPRRGDERDAKPPTTWSLQTRKQLGDEFDRYCKDGVTGFVYSQDIST